MLLRSLFFLLPLLLLVSACDNEDKEITDPSCETAEEIPDLPGWKKTVVSGTYIFGSAPRFQFLDDKRGYALGATLIRTTDGGGTWLEDTGFPRPAMSNLLELSVAGEDNIFILVEQFMENDPIPERVLMRTLDGGDTWETFKGYEWLLSRISFLNAEKGFALGFKLDQEGIFLLRTDDGGETWDDVDGVSFLIPYSIFQISWRSADLGIVDAGGEKSYVTKDGGDTWTPVSNDASVPSNYFLVDDNTIFAHSNYAAAISDDLGQSWTGIDEASVHILSMIDESGLALILTPECQKFGPNRMAFATSYDGGITWASSALIPSPHVAPAATWYLRQEVAPGLFVFYQPAEQTFYWFRKE